MLNSFTGVSKFGRRRVAGPSTVVTNGLQLYLEPSQYSGSGTSWTDSSANAYTVDLVGAPTYTLGSKSILVSLYTSSTGYAPYNGTDCTLIFLSGDYSNKLGYFLQQSSDGISNWISIGSPILYAEYDAGQNKTTLYIPPNGLNVTWGYTTRLTKPLYFTFDGTSEYFDTNQSLASEEFSVGCWFRTSAAGIKMLISKETVAGNPWNYRIWLNGGQLNVDMSQAPATQSALSSTSTTYNNGSWYLVMFTRDDSNWYLYVNGTQIRTKSDPYTGSVTNAQEVWFGRSAYTAGYQYTGDLGECFVYDRVLSSSEILQNFNATKAAYGL